MRAFIPIFTVVAALCVSAFAADPQSSFCSFEDGNEVSIQYNPSVKDGPRNGKVWSPGAVLYVQTPLTLGSSSIGLGAYSVHFIPDKKSWTIIVNKNVTAGAAYDQAQDVARALMEVGELPQPVGVLQLAFGQSAPKQCTLRAYFQKTGAFTEFTEK